MSTQPPGRDDDRARGSRGDEAKRPAPDQAHRPVVTGTAAARYNAARGAAPTDAERTQTLPAQSADGAGGSAAGRTGGAEDPPWQRGRGTAVVDAPTSSIKRSQLPTDMPDLSSSRSGRSSSAGSSGSQGKPSSGSGTSRASGAGGRGSRKGPRRASLQLKHVDPWSVLKLSLVLSIAMFLVWMVAVGVLYLVLDAMGVWDRLNSTFSEFVTSSDPTATSSPLIGPGRIFGVAAIIGAINIVLLTALATIGSFIYNLSADLAGGVEVTLTERD